jgi:hypothetical protein
MRSNQLIVKGPVSALLVSAIALVGASSALAVPGRARLRGTFAVRIDPCRLEVGVHRLTAQVTFQRGSATKGKTLRLSFQRCPRALRAPRFTG